jgi:hypothetical protein
MAVIGFKEYNDKDRYAARRTVNKGANLIWKIVVMVVVVVGIGFLVKVLIPVGKTVLNAINPPNM